MLNFKITVTGGGTPCKWRAGLHEKIVTGSAAGELQKLMAAHLDARGGRSYWHEAAKHVETSANEAGAVVSINHRGVRLHFYGGTVKPTGRISNVTGKPIKRLLIPGENSPLRKANVELYELGLDRDAVRIEEGKLMADIGGVPVELGVLAKKAEHDPDPTVLPKPEQMAEALHTGAAKALQRLNI